MLGDSPSFNPHDSTAKYSLPRPIDGHDVSTGAHVAVVPFAAQVQYAYYMPHRETRRITRAHSHTKCACLRALPCACACACVWCRDGAAGCARVPSRFGWLAVSVASRHALVFADRLRFVPCRRCEIPTGNATVTATNVSKPMGAVSVFVLGLEVSVGPSVKASDSTSPIRFGGSISMHHVSPCSTPPPGLLE
jgi:hypothetical protein